MTRSPIELFWTVKNIEGVKVWNPGIRDRKKWRQRVAKRAKHNVLDQKSFFYWNFFVEHTLLEKKISS